MLFPRAPALLPPRSKRTQRHGRAMARRTLIPEGKTGERGNAKHAHTSVNPRHAPRPTPPAHNSEHPTPRTQRSTAHTARSQSAPSAARVPRADAAAAPHVRSARPRFCARPPAAGKGRQSRASRGSFVRFLCRRPLALPSTSPPWTIGRSVITSCTGCPVWCHLLHRQIPDISGLSQGGVSDWYISVPIGGVSVCLGN